ncbi:MAG: AAA family ATPase [Magnetococcales bacterium]|nr:AAA family ATPase [Magnetococcales bacterium]
MIKRLTLHNWKSFSDAQLEIDPLTVLIGTNASGKSNALDAILFLHRISTGVSLTEALSGNASLPPLRGGLEWAALKGERGFSLSVLVEGEEKTDYEYNVTVAINDSKCIIASEYLLRRRYRTENRGGRPYEIYLFWTDGCQDDSPGITARLYNEKRGAPRQSLRSHAILSQLGQQTLRKEITDGVEQVTSMLRGIFILDPIPANMRGFSSFSDTFNHDASNIAGVIAALSIKKKRELEAAIKKYMRRLPERDILRIWAEPVGRFRSDAILYCEEGWRQEGASEELVDSRGMSDGTLRFLAILTALITMPVGNLLVIEEVDNGLHPSRAGLLVSMLKEIGAERKVDVLATTHNPALLDALGPEMIPYVTVSHRDPETGHSQLTLLEDVPHLPRLLAMGSVGRLSSSGKLEQAISGREGE